MARPRSRVRRIRAPQSVADCAATAPHKRHLTVESSRVRRMSVVVETQHTGSADTRRKRICEEHRLFPLVRRFIESLASAVILTSGIKPRKLSGLIYSPAFPVWVALPQITSGLGFRSRLQQRHCRRISRRSLHRRGERTDERLAGRLHRTSKFFRYGCRGACNAVSMRRTTNSNRSGSFNIGPVTSYVTP